MKTQKITLKQVSGNDQQFYAEFGETGKQHLVEIVKSSQLPEPIRSRCDTDGLYCIRSVGGNPNRILLVTNPLFWLDFFEGKESLEVEVEKHTI